MKLSIDTSKADIIVIGINKRRFVSDSKVEKSQKLLSFLDEVLKREKYSLMDVNEIEVATGPGSYTGLRVGVSVAQTLGWVLKIPVNGKKVYNGEVVEIKYI